QRRRTLEAHQAALKQQAEQLEYQATHHQELAGWVTSVTAFCLRVQAGLAQATFEQRRQLVELLIDRVVVTDEVVEIRYVIPTTSASEHVRFCHLRTLYFAEGQLTQMMDIAQCVATGPVRPVADPAVVHAHAAKVRQDADGTRRLCPALGVDGVVGEPVRAGHMRPGQSPPAAYAGLVTMQHWRRPQGGRDPLRHGPQRAGGVLYPAHERPPPQLEPQQVG